MPICVQCNQEFDAASNCSSACEYKAEDGSTSLSKHYENHHNDHVYESKMAWFSKLRDEEGWESLYSLDNPSYGMGYSVSGNLFRMKKTGDLFVYLCNNDVKSGYMKLLTQEDLKEIESKGEAAAEEMKALSKSEKAGKGVAQWLFQNDELVGIKFELAAIDHFKPATAQVFLSWKGETINLDHVEDETTGAFAPHDPDGSYFQDGEATSGAYLRNLVVLPEIQTKEARGDVWSHDGETLSVKTDSLRFGGRKVESREEGLDWNLSLTNKANHEIEIKDVVVEYAIPGQPLAAPSTLKHRLDNPTRGPMTIKKGESSYFNLSVWLNQTRGKDGKLTEFGSFITNAFGAGLFLRAKFITAADDAAYVLTEFCNPGSWFKNKPMNSSAFFYAPFDDPELFQRSMVEFSEDWNCFDIRFGVTSVSVSYKVLDRAVLKAIKEGVDCVEHSEPLCPDSVADAKLYFWIDRDVQRVAVFEVVIKKNDSQMVAFAQCPSYGPSSGKKVKPSLNFSLPKLFENDAVSNYVKFDWKEMEEKAQQVSDFTEYIPNTDSKATTQDTSSILEAVRALGEKVDKLAGLELAVAQLNRRVQRLEGMLEARERALQVEKNLK